jgi:formylglycine-generating enzyme required for sulfatase activity
MGFALRQAQEWMEKRGNDLPEALRQFINRSGKIDWERRKAGIKTEEELGRLLAEKEARAQRERADAEARARREAERSATRDRMRAQSLRAVVGVLLIGIGAGLAWSNRADLKALAVMGADKVWYKVLAAEAEHALQPLQSFKECFDCPEMVVVPAGSFTMGSPKNETGRFDAEGPQHTVKIAKPFAVGKFHVTVDQFAAFVMETGYDAGSKCYVFEGGRPFEKEGRSWRDPGFAQAGPHPAVCLSWNDANTYADWLARKTGKTYRLVTEAEWEYAARARTEPGSYPRYSFEEDLCRYGNGADQSTKSLPGTKDWTFAPCNDGYVYTSPVGSFAENGFGLYDMQGDAGQRTADCWHESYAGAPSDGTAWTAGDCGFSVLRGGSWLSFPRNLRAAVRGRDSSGNRINNLGFRLARTLNP